jgi:outer membrane protein assembly factor BamB
MPFAPLLALALAATPAEAGRLPPAPRALYSVAWKRALVPTQFGDYQTRELGGAAVDATGEFVVVGTRDGWLHALRHDGALAWEFQGQGPFAAEPLIDGGVVYAGCHDGNLYALDLATGALRWQYQAKEQMGTRPALVNGLVVVASLQDTVFAVEAATGAWKWHHRRDVSEGFTIHGAASVKVDGDRVFAAFSDGTVSSLDAATGQVRWERPLSPPGRYQDIDSLAVADGRVFLAAFAGAVMAVEASTGATIWSQPYTGAARLLVERGAVLAVTAKEVVSLSVKDGKPNWVTPLTGSASGALRIVGRALLVPAHDGGLRIIEVASGRLFRVLDPGSGISSSPAVHGRRVYTLSNAGLLLAFDLD